MFYDLCVNSCYTAQTIQSHQPSEGKMFVVVNITVTNTYKSTLTMTDSHFQLQTLSSSGSDEEASASSDSDVSYALPLTSEGTVFNLSDELPGEYELAKGESRTGTLVFEMPVSETVFNFCTADYFNYGSGKTVSGNTYFVEITPEAQ